jgi:phosphoglycolate phosphatase
VGDGARVLVARALAEPPESALVEEALARFHRYYEANPVVHTTLAPGALEVLAALGDRPAALVTNKPRGATVAVLSALGLAARFAVVRTGSDGALKPDPRALLEPLEAMRFSASEAWMVGDGEQDVRAGRAAGCQTVGVRGGLQGDAKLLAAAPDALVDSLSELAAILQRHDA